MKANRSMPPGTIIPELAYADVRAAAKWLCEAFGFRERLRIGTHRCQLVLGDASVVATELRDDASASSRGLAHSVLVRVEDVDGHHDRVRRRGARILRPPETHPFGERQYTVEDLGGHVWTFTESVADVAPEAWGGEPVNP